MSGSGAIITVPGRTMGLRRADPRGAGKFPSERHTCRSGWRDRGTRVAVREQPWHTKGTAVAFRVPGPRSSGANRPLVLPRWPKLVIPTVIIVVAAIILISVVAGIW